MVLAIIGAGLLVFGVLLVLPYIGSLNGVSYGYFPVTHLGGLGIFLIIIGLISAVLSIATRNSSANTQVNEAPPATESAGPLRNFP